MPKRVKIELDHKHSQEVCNEIGERLKIKLSRKVSPPLPRKMQNQLDKLRQVDERDASSVVSTRPSKPKPIAALLQPKR